MYLHYERMIYEVVCAGYMARVRCFSFLAPLNGVKSRPVEILVRGRSMIASPRLWI